MFLRHEVCSLSAKLQTHVVEFVCEWAEFV